MQKWDLQRSVKTVDPTLIPQADDLAKIRRVVAAVASGATSVEQIGRDVDLAARHAAYAVAAARALGWLSPGEPLEVSRHGADLLETEPGSREEAGAMHRAIQTSPVLAAVGPGLLGDKPPSRRQLTETIERRAGLAQDPRIIELPLSSLLLLR